MRGKGGCKARRKVKSGGEGRGDTVRKGGVRMRRGEAAGMEREKRK